MRGTSGALLAISALLLLAACSAGEPATTPSPRSSSPAPSISSSSSFPAPTPAPVTAWRPVGEPETVATGLAAPWSLVPLEDGTALVSLRDSGEILELDPAGATRTVGTVTDVVAEGEGGLLGLAVAETDRESWVYAYFTSIDDNRVVRMPLAGVAGSRTLGEALPVIEGIPRAVTHDGGRIAFGPDGRLYVATGDASEREPAQEPTSLAGKILRLTPEGAPAPGNPFADAVYSLGHRNVQGVAWTADGTLWASEFGQDTFDEVNRIVAGGNYGWPVHEGVGDDPAFVDPVVTWSTDEASPSGLAAIGRTLFVAGLRGERVWMIDVVDGAADGAPVALWTGQFGRVRDVVIAGDQMWLLTSNTDGRGTSGPDDDRVLRVRLSPA